MRGTVGVASAPGRGATFFLRVPLAPAPAAAPAARSAPPSLLGARALIVEDLDYNARALAAMLRKLGFTVDLARNGEEALRQLAHHAYHSVFLDYDLPDMSGPEVVRRLRAREKGRAHTLVVATTAYTTTEDRDACLAAGMDKFLSKPITPDKLHAVLADLPGTPLPAPSMHLPAGADSGINLRMLAYLAGDDAKSLRREIARYLDSLLDAHDEVTGALAIRSRHALGKGAHHLLSHARMIDAAGLAAAAEALENAADFADDEELDRLAADVAAALAALRKTLDRHHSPSAPA
jgi:CheY-like chemotaxis protein